MKPKYLLLAVLVSMAFLPCFPQTSAPQSKASPAKAPKTKPIPTSIPNTDDIESVVRQLVALGSGTKGEFETTAQFEARVQKAVQPEKQYRFAYCTGLRPSSSFVPFGGCDYTYDADQETMTVYVGIEERQFTPGYDSLPAIRIKNVTRRTEHHVGTNSFGVRAPFTSRFEDDFGVVPSQASVSWLVSLSRTSPEEAKLRADELELLREMYPTLHSPAFSFPLSIEKARDIQSRLRILLVGTVPDTLVYRDESFRPATLSGPLEVTINRFYVKFLVNEVRIVDSRTGNMLANFTHHKPDEQ